MEWETREARKAQVKHETQLKNDHEPWFTTNLVFFPILVLFSHLQGVSPLTLESQEHRLLLSLSSLVAWHVFISLFCL